MGGMLHSIVKYEILGRIAKGGMAEVYLCRAQGAGGYEKLVVVKKIRAELAETKGFVEMFMDEAAISVQLQHSNIGHVFDFGRVNDTYIITMEYIHGVSLREICERFKKEEKYAPVPMIAFIIAELCGALHYAHSKTNWKNEPLNIIHRDVNPRNVMVTLEGEVKLIDFGIAKAAQRNYETVVGIKGKVSYMSPEQAAGKPLDNRSDIFCAGALLFEMLTGRKLFEGDNDISLLKRVEKAQIPTPSSEVENVHTDLERICLRALAKDPKDRYVNAGEMQEELNSVRYDEWYGSRQLGEWMKEAFSERLERINKLLAEEDRNKPQPQLFVQAAPDSLLLDPSDGGKTSTINEPTHLFMAPADDLAKSLSRNPTVVFKQLMEEISIINGDDGGDPESLAEETPVMIKTLSPKGRESSAPERLIHGAPEHKIAEVSTSHTVTTERYSSARVVLLAVVITLVLVSLAYFIVFGVRQAPDAMPKHEAPAMDAGSFKKPDAASALPVADAHKERAKPPGEMVKSPLRESDGALGEGAVRPQASERRWKKTPATPSKARPPSPRRPKAGRPLPRRTEPAPKPVWKPRKERKRPEPLPY